MAYTKPTAENNLDHVGLVGSANWLQQHLLYAGATPRGGAIYCGGPARDLQVEKELINEAFTPQWIVRALPMLFWVAPRAKRIDKSHVNHHFAWLLCVINLYLLLCNIRGHSNGIKSSFCV